MVLSAAQAPGGRSRLFHVMSAVPGDRGNTPHPAFGHPLPAHAGRGATTQRVPLLPACGEKVPEGRMRGSSSPVILRRVDAEGPVTHVAYGSFAAAPAQERMNPFARSCSTM